MTTNQPIPYWPTSKPAHEEASIPYWPVDVEPQTGFWSDAAWEELCAYADRFDEISDDAQAYIWLWARVDAPFSLATCIPECLEAADTEAAHLIREMGPAEWANRCRKVA